jgi:hypothetical protein
LGAGIKIETLVKKINQERLMKKRNKRIECMATVELTPLTEQILAQMGQEGVIIRKRLKTFYRERVREDQGYFEVEEFLENVS